MGEFFSSCATCGFSRRPQLHGIKMGGYGDKEKKESKVIYV